jgi:hypothetical protein
VPVSRACGQGLFPSDSFCEPRFDEEKSGLLVFAAYLLKICLLIVDLRFLTFVFDYCSFTFR